MWYPPAVAATGAYPVNARSTADLGRLTWGTGMRVGLYGDPPGQTGAGLTYAALDRTRDGLRIQAFEWLTYPSARRAPPMPHSPQVLSEALLAAARRL